MTADNTVTRAAEVIVRFLPPMPGTLGERQALATAQALADANLLATVEHDRKLAATAWDEGHKQGGPMHDVDYDDPGAHNRNPYRAAGEHDE